MARVKFGDGVSGQSGSLNANAGGVTYLKNNVKRMRVVPTNPQTPSQQESRALFSFLTKAWSGTLNDTQRNAWETARTSDPYYQTQDNFYGVSRKVNSGKSLFIMMNTNLLVSKGLVGEPQVLISVPGTAAGQDEIAITSFAFDVSSQSAILTYTGIFSNEAAVIRATPGVAPGNMRTTSVKSKFRTLLGSDPTGASPLTLSTTYIDKNGPVGSTGDKVFWEIYGVDQGTGKSRLIASDFSVVVA